MKNTPYTTNGMASSFLFLALLLLLLGANKLVQLVQFGLTVLTTSTSQTPNLVVAVFVIGRVDLQTVSKSNSPRYLDNLHHLSHLSTSPASAQAPACSCSYQDS